MLRYLFTFTIIHVIIKYRHLLRFAGHEDFRACKHDSTWGGKSYEQFQDVKNDWYIDTRYRNDFYDGRL